MSDVSRDTMLLTTPFHSRVEAMCDLNDWGNWMGYTTPNAYFDVELEYFAVRSTTGVFDLSPMNKYRVTGPDAQRYLDRLITRDVSKIGVDRVGYAIWCDDNGQVMDDGTIFRLGEQDYRICSYQRADDWLAWNTLGFDVTIENESEAVAGLAVQGPTSCTVLTLLGCTDLNQLKPFGIAHYSFEGRPLMVSRTGFTGDLGYEVWVPPESAEALWDQLFELGRDYLIKPIGSHALELARIEAGFLQANVDFMPAEEVVRVGRTRSPFELGLGWLVDFKSPLQRPLGAAQRARKGFSISLCHAGCRWQQTGGALLHSQGRQAGRHGDLCRLVPDGQGQYCLCTDRDALRRRRR